jgi:hypothetical protein
MILKACRWKLSCKTFWAHLKLIAKKRLTQKIVDE